MVAYSCGSAISISQRSTHIGAPCECLSFHARHQYKFHNALPILVRRTNINFTRLYPYWCATRILLERCESEIGAETSYEIAQPSSDFNRDQMMTSASQLHSEVVRPRTTVIWRSYDVVLFPYDYIGACDCPKCVVNPFFQDYHKT